MDTLTSAPDLSHTAQLQALRRIEQLRDCHLSDHESNVSRVCQILCNAIGLDDHFMQTLTSAAELHDIGKLAIADSVLLKPAPLSQHEMNVMRTHTQFGHDILLG